VIALALALAAVLRPLGGFEAGMPANLLLGLVVAGLALTAELAIRAGSPWAAAGAVGGVLVGGLLAAILSRLLPEGVGGTSARQLRPLVYLVVVYAASFAGAKVGEALAAEGFRGLRAKGDDPPGAEHTIVDTSVIIDGRIADVAETGFLDGVFVVPGFVLRELQYIADAPDPRRAGAAGSRPCRGSRSPIIRVFTEGEVPEIRQVDLADQLTRRYRASCSRTSYNLNRSHPCAAWRS
jgi:uncharacterized protein YacL